MRRPVRLQRRGSLRDFTLQLPSSTVLDNEFNEFGWHSACSTANETHLLKGGPYPGAQRATPVDLLQVSPVRAHAHLHLKWHGERMHVLHVLPHQRFHNLHFVLGNLEHQLVMHLQRHPGFESALA